MFLNKPKNYIFIEDDELMLINLHKNRKNQHVINKILQKRIPDGIIDDGKVIRKHQLMEIFKSISKNFRLKKGKVYLILPDEAVGSKFFHIPSVSDKEVEDFMEIEAERISDFTLNETLIDYSILEKKEKRINLHLATINKNIIHDYQEIIWKTLKNCHAITFRGDTIWPCLTRFCGRDRGILLELYDDVTFVSAGKNNQTYLYWQKFHAIDSLAEMQTLIKEVDTYLEQEVNIEKVKRIYIWDARKGKFEYPQINNGHSWTSLTIDDLSINVNDQFKQFYQNNSVHFLPLIGMIFNEI